MNYSMVMLVLLSGVVQASESSRSSSRSSSDSSSSSILGKRKWCDIALRKNGVFEVFDDEETAAKKIIKKLKNTHYSSQGETLDKLKMSFSFSIGDERYMMLALNANTLKFKKDSCNRYSDWFVSSSGDVNRMPFSKDAQTDGWWVRFVDKETFDQVCPSSSKEEAT